MCCTYESQLLHMNWTLYGCELKIAANNLRDKYIRGWINETKLIRPVRYWAIQIHWYTVYWARTVRISKLSLCSTQRVHSIAWHIVSNQFIAERGKRFRTNSWVKFVGPKFACLQVRCPNLKSAHFQYQSSSPRCTNRSQSTKSSKICLDANATNTKHAKCNRTE